MGAHLPYRNTYHKEIYPFVEQTHHYTPDNIGCRFDGRIMSVVTASPPSFSRAHPVPHVSYSAFYASHHLCFLYYKLSRCINFISFQSLPRSINSLHSHTSQFHHNRFILPPLSPSRYQLQQEQHWDPNTR